MSKEIWLSPILGSNRNLLVERCASMLARGERDQLVYIAASRPLLELITKWVLNTGVVSGVWGTFPFFLFRGFVSYVLGTAVFDGPNEPVPQRKRIDIEESNYAKSLLSQIMLRLAARGDLNALKPLVQRDGTINTIAELIGEIQRAATSPQGFKDIIERRASDVLRELVGDGATPFPPRQLDFDREVGAIYEGYTKVLDAYGLTEDDADQMRAFQILGGQIDGRTARLPWLDTLDLLVLDGFFDFTPVQGQMLRLLMSHSTNVIVNLYGDNENPEVFRPFEETIAQLESMSGGFEVVVKENPRRTGPVARTLRTRLFNPSTDSQADVAKPEEEAKENDDRDSGVAISPRLLRCADRETEVRAIAKEIKRLVIREKYSIRDIALVVRQRAAYTETITRVFADEQIPCSVERTVNLTDVPAVRAIQKLFRILGTEGDAANPRVSELADLIKSGYFRLSNDAIALLRGVVQKTEEQGELFDETPPVAPVTPSAHRSPELAAVGAWDPDVLENVIAYVGSELRFHTWRERARQLARMDARSSEVMAELFGEESEEVQEGEDQEPPEDAEDTEEPLAPTREIHPAAIEWTRSVISQFATVIKDASKSGDPSTVRQTLLVLLDQLQFSQTIRSRFTNNSLELVLPHAALDLRALSSIRSAIADAIRAIECAAKATGDDNIDSITLAELVREIERCIGERSLRVATADHDGLQVLEATDVRGLRFKAIFIAGLIEGGFPLRRPRDWIYPHEERERLKQYGLTLEDISPATLLKEEHYFYQVACRATERLYLTWPLVLEGGGETVVSYYIDELRHALAPLELTYEDVRRDTEGEALFDSSSKEELGASLVRLSERHLHRGRKQVPVAKDDVDKVLEWALENNVLSQSAMARIAIGHERAGDRYGRYDGVITDDNLRAMLAERFGENYVWSASALGLFGKSPFKFFAQRVLKLESRIEAALDLAALDAGGLVHETLRRFFAAHRGVRLTHEHRDSLRAEMRETADRVFGQRERAIPPLNVNVWRIDKEIYRLQLDRVVDYEIELQTANEDRDVLPQFFELGFGMAEGLRDENSISDYLVIERALRGNNGTEAIRLRGQIDRVDVAGDGTLIAYDYKLRKGASLADMNAGRDLQMGIYIDALQTLFFPKAEIAGGGYYIVRSCDRNRGLYRKTFDGYTRVGSRVSSRVDDETWSEMRKLMRQRAWQFVDAIRKGRFIVHPTDPVHTCGICDYRDVCRYEKFRILRKIY